jgi:hypothetical protein
MSFVRATHHISRMGDRKTVRLQSRQLNAAEGMVRDNAADDKSDAIRTALDRGFTDLGYYSSNSELQQILSLTGRVLSLATAAWLAATWLMPVSYRLPAILMAAGAAVCFGAEKVSEIRNGRQWAPAGGPFGGRAD